MASIIAAGTTTTTALVYTADTSGVLQLQTNGTTTAVTIDTSQNVTFAGKLTSASSLVLASNGSTTALTVDTSQNIGVGTTPTYKVDVSGAFSNDGVTPAMRLVNTSANGYANLRLQGNSRGGAVDFYSGASTAQASILVNSSMQFYIGGNGSTGTQAMTLDNSGNLMVGATATGTTLRVYGGTTTGAICRVGANASTFNPFQFVYDSSGGGSTSGTQVGTISCTTSSTAYNTSSDARLKNLIGVATDTSVIDNIVVNDFTWKVDGSTDRGVFAQDAIHIKPSAIHQGKDDLDEHGLPTTPWGVDYSKFVPDLIVYCKALKAELEALKLKVGA